MGNLAGTYSKQKKYEEAEELQLKVLGLHRRMLGPEHPHTLTSMASLGAIYEKQEKNKEAEELWMEIHIIQQIMQNNQE